jgi:tRNA-specific 2-thiouridylase
MRVAAYLDIPFLTFDLADVYKKEVADYMIREYRVGRTPNPDVMCNKEVKFGAFLKKALSMGADYVATGHYTQAVHKLKKNSAALPVSGLRHGRNFSSIYELLKGIDFSKDQSYFLWTLKQEQLKKILFPVGHLKKTAVRKLAQKFNLPVAEKKDSQGICFLGAVDLKEFLKHYIKEKKGEVLNEKGEKIGFHDGAVFHTLGERHGFTITKKSPKDGAYYVVGKDIKKNILIVSTSPQPSPYKGEGEIQIQNINWISKSYPLKAKSYTCQIRYHGEFLPCQISNIKKNTASVFFEKRASGLPVRPLVAAGQSCVIYDGDICLGGGVVV